jgi:hypothetical protein
VQKGGGVGLRRRAAKDEEQKTSRGRRRRPQEKTREREALKAYKRRKCEESGS